MNPLIESNCVIAPNLSLQINDFGNYQVLQRNFGGHSKNVVVKTTYMGHNAILEARILNYSTGETIVDWTQLESSDQRNYKKTIQIPEGGWYKINVRAVNGNGIEMENVTSSNKWGVGINILCIGQSNMTGTGSINPSIATDGRTSYTIADDLVAVYSSGSWKHLVDPYDPKGNGSMAPALGNALARKYNIPIGMVPAAYSGAGLAVDPNNAWPNWITRDETNHYSYTSLNIYGRSITWARDAGGVEAVVMNQGEHDVSMGTSPSEYDRMLRQLIGYYYEDTRQNNPFYICQLGGISSTISALTGKDDIYEGIRNAHMNVDNGTNIFMGATEFALSKNQDGIHYSVSSLDIIGERIANAMMYYYGDSTYYRGPKVVSANFDDYSKSVIKVKIQHSGGTDFTPTSNITGFTVFDDSIKVSIKSAIKVDSTTIKITLDSPIQNTASIKYLYGHNPDITGLIKDNSSLNLPLESTPNLIVVQ